MKAIYYLPNYNLDSCINLYSNQFLFSEIDEINLWCDPDRYGTLMGLMFGISRQALSLALIATSLFSVLLI